MCKRQQEKGINSSFQVDKLYVEELQVLSLTEMADLLVG